MNSGEILSFTERDSTQLSNCVRKNRRQSLSEITNIFNTPDIVLSPRELLKGSYTLQATTSFLSKNESVLHM